MRTGQYLTKWSSLWKGQKVKIKYKLLNFSGSFIFVFQTAICKLKLFFASQFRYYYFKQFFLFLKKRNPCSAEVTSKERMITWSSKQKQKLHWKAKKKKPCRGKFWMHYICEIYDHFSSDWERNSFFTVSAVEQDLNAFSQGVDVFSFPNKRVPFFCKRRKSSQYSRQHAGNLMVTVNQSIRKSKKYLVIIFSSY